MDEEEYLSLRPILPNYEIIGAPILSDNAITVRRENVPGADTPRGFGRGQAAARLLREGRLPVDYNTHNFGKTGVGTSDGYYSKGNLIYGQHGNDGGFIRIDEHTPLADTYDVSRIAVVNPEDSTSVAKYFPGDNTFGGGQNVTNSVGYFRPDLNVDKAIPDINMPWDDKANVYAHQLVRGLSDTLRQFGVTDEELRKAGINGFGGLNGDSLRRLATSPNSNERIKVAVQAFMGAPDYPASVHVYDPQTKAHLKYLQETSKFIRDNYRDAPYVKVMPGDGERYTDLTAPHTYAKGGRMQNASMRPWEKRSGTTYQYLQEQDRARREKKQKEIESMVDIDDMAIRALRGEFGNGAERKKHLGAVYSAVQRRVNEMLTELQSRRAADAKRRETEANRAMERRADGLTPQRGVRPSVSEPSRETIRSGGQSMSRLDGDDEYDMYF